MITDKDFIKLLKFNKRPFRAHFLPNSVFLALDAYKNDIEALSKYLKKFKVTVRTELNADITAGGEFCESGKMYLTVFGDYDNYVFSDEDWYMFKFRVVQTIMHELIHWSQHEKRGHSECRVLKYVSKHPQAAYYSSVDEICAYAHCVVMELHREYPGVPIIEVITHYGGETYDFIFNVVFKNDFDNMAVKRYVKEILRWEKVYKSKIV